MLRFHGRKAALSEAGFGIIMPQARRQEAGQRPGCFQIRLGSVDPRRSDAAELERIAALDDRAEPRAARGRGLNCELDSGVDTRDIEFVRSCRVPPERLRTPASLRIELVFAICGNCDVPPHA